MTSEASGADDVVHRRVLLDPAQLVFDAATGRPVGPSSACLLPDEDGTSVYSGTCLDIRDVPLSQIAASSDRECVTAAWAATTLTAEGLRVVPDPQPEPASIGQCHALIQGWPDTSGQKRRTAQRLRKSSSVSWPEGSWSDLPVRLNPNGTIEWIT